MYQARVYEKKSYVRNIIKMDGVDSLATFEEKLDNAQRPRIDSNKRFLPRPNTTTA